MNKISKLFISILIFLPFGSFGQDWNRIFEYELDAEYQMSERLFEKAAETYMKALKLIPNSANLKFKIGYCYFKTDDKQNEALTFLEEASKDISEKYDPKSIKETQAPPEALLHLGKAYQFNYKFNEAISCYNKYKTFIKSDDPGQKVVDQSIKDCKNSMAVKPTSLKVKITNLGKKINNDQSNFNPIISGDGLTFAYTTQAKKGYDIYVAKINKDSISIPKKITPYLGDNFFKTVSLSSDGLELILVLDDPINSDLYVSTFDKNRWSKAVKLNKIINSKFNETHACMSQDGNTLYFTSDRKGGLGGLDIYKTTISDEGEWSKPENLGPSINTEFNEDNPFLTPDGKMLFFCSEGHDGYGGYDIYYTNLDGSLKAVNLGYPLNDARNNNFYFPDGGLEYGYTAICNQNGFGKNDIVHIQLSKVINLSGTVTPEKQLPAQLTNFNVTLLDVDQNEVIQLTTDQSNNFNQEITPGKYLLTVKGDKFVDFSKEFIIPDDYSEEIFRVDALISPVVEAVQVAENVSKPTIIDSTKIVAQATTKNLEKVEESKVAMVEPVKPIEEKKIEKKEPTKKEKKESVKKETKKQNIAEVPRKPKVEPVISRTISSNEEGTVVVYTVQLMALDKQISTDYFKGLNNVEITASSDGIYRYNAGSSESMETAIQILKNVQAKGHPKAFIRIDRVKPTFRIQLLALKKSVDLSYFANLTKVEENKGTDDFFRYFVGKFDSKEDALADLQRIKNLGYKDAFVKKVLF